MPKKRDYRSRVILVKVEVPSRTHGPCIICGKRIPLGGTSIYEHMVEHEAQGKAEWEAAHGNKAA